MNAIAHRPIQVLLVEDNPGDVRLLQEIIGEVGFVQFELTAVEYLSKALNWLGEDRFDVVLLDLSLPDSQGLETFITLYRSAPAIPIIILTGLDDETLAIKAVQEGAQDYLVKGQVSGNMLVRSIRYAIERKRAEELLQQRIERERLVNAISQHIRQSLDLDEVLNTTVEEVRQFLQVDRVLIYYLLKDGSGEVINESVLPEYPVFLGRTFLEEAFPREAHQAYYQGKIRAITDVEQDSIEPCQAEFLRQLGVQAKLVVPVLLGENLWGLLIAHHCRDSRLWQSLEIELLQQLATQLGIAIQQSELYARVQDELIERKRAEAALQQRIERERLITAIAQRIRRSLDLGEILRTTVEEVRQFFKVDRTFIYHFHPDWSGTVVVESVGDGWTSTLDTQIADSYFMETRGEDYRQGRIQAVADIYTAGLTECHVDLLAQFEIKATLAVPILQGERLLGLLVANQCSAPRQWQSWETELLQQLATQLGIAIQQSQLYAQVQAELSDRKRAEQIIREQVALLDITTDAIIVRDLNYRILFWSRGAERLFGWSAKEAIGENANTLLYKEITPQLEKALQDVREQGKWQGELQKVTKEGSEVIVESRWTLARDADGQTKSILTVDTDITEKKQLEAQFFRIQRLESLGTLSSGIAHDLNNILAPILAASQLLQLRFPNDDERNQRMLKIIEASAERGTDLVKQVLSFARGMEGKRMNLQVSHSIAEIQQIARQTFPKSIEFSTDIPDDLWLISGDATQLHQVLMNLVVNARDAMPDGGTLRISAENLFLDENYARLHLEAQVGPYIAIAVSDSGTGIPPEILDRIFEPFFTTKGIGKGTGLGLSTAIGIVKSHGGFVDVTSQVGQGTEFKLFLPAVLETETLLPEGLEPTAGHGELVLVVDDEAHIREITKVTLETNDYKVLTANDGIEAIAQYAEHRNEIGVILMDMMMPSMDGATAIRTLQKMNPQVQIVATSGLASTEAVAKATGQGVRAFLSKPFSTKELLKTLNEVLRKNA